MADPSQMTDEELNKVIETGIEPEEPETPQEEPVEEPEEEPVEEVEQEEKESVENDEEEVPAPMSRRKQHRIEQLLNKLDYPVRPVEQAKNEPSQRIDYEQQLEADPEVIRQLEADRKAAADIAYELGQQESNARLEYQQFYNNIRFDLPVVKDKLDKLDPDDVRAIDLEYMKLTGADPSTMTVRHPDIGYADFVEARIEQAERLAASMNAQTVKNVTKQAAATGLRPDGSSAKRLNLNQSASQMTDEELLAITGGVPYKPE